jgi:hypothetical protein
MRGPQSAAHRWTFFPGDRDEPVANDARQKIAVKLHNVCRVALRIRGRRVT